MKLFTTLFDIATLPVDLLKDVVSVGGTTDGKEKSYTREKFEKIDEDIKS